MKKLISVVLLVLLCSAIFVGCAPTVEEEADGPLNYTMVAPDGAPALAISQLMSQNMQFDNNFSYSVVAADQIKNSFVGNGAHADFGLLPVNLASLLLGSGTEYKMIGVVTHGNLYFLSKNATQITVDNAKDTLKGKTIAVVNLSAVPGLTTKALLNKIGLAFTEDEGAKTAENVLLKGIKGTEIGVSLTALQNAADYVIAPEPAVSTFTTTAPVIKKVGALHDVYGRYPQAVLVVKSAILNADKQLVNAVFDAICGANDFVKENTQLAVDAVSNHLAQGVTPSFDATNTTAQSVEGCGINLQPMDEQTIAKVNAYVADIIAVKSGSAKPFENNFFVDISK